MIYKVSTERGQHQKNVYGQKEGIYLSAMIIYSFVKQFFFLILKEQTVHAKKIPSITYTPPGKLLF